MLFYLFLLSVPPSIVSTITVPTPQSRTTPGVTDHTASPGLVSGSTPTLTPGLEGTKTPTAAPGLENSKTPTSVPGINNSQFPTTIPNTVSTKMPYICKQGWSDFMNIDKPNILNAWESNGPGDVEPISELRNYYSFCANPTGIQCRTALMKQPYTMTLDKDVSCDLVTGLECLGAKQGTYPCEDYEVSVFCECGCK